MKSRVCESVGFDNVTEHNSTDRKASLVRKALTPDKPKTLANTVFSAFARVSGRLPVQAGDLGFEGRRIARVARDRTVLRQRKCQCCFGSFARVALSRITRHTSPWLRSPCDFLYASIASINARWHGKLIAASNLSVFFGLPIRFFGVESMCPSVTARSDRRTISTYSTYSI